MTIRYLNIHVSNCLKRGQSREETLKTVYDYQVRNEEVERSSSEKCFELFTLVGTNLSKEINLISTATIATIGSGIVVEMLSNEAIPPTEFNRLAIGGLVVISAAISFSSLFMIDRIRKIDSESYRVLGGERNYKICRNAYNKSEFCIGLQIAKEKIGKVLNKTNGTK